MERVFWGWMITTFIVLMIVAETINTPFLTIATLIFGVAVLIGFWINTIHEIEKEEEK